MLLYSLVTQNREPKFFSRLPRNLFFSLTKFSHSFLFSTIYITNCFTKLAHKGVLFLIFFGFSSKLLLCTPLAHLWVFFKPKNTTDWRILVFRLSRPIKACLLRIKIKLKLCIPTFFSAFTNEQLPLPKISTSSYPSITDLQILPDGVAKQLSQLNPNKACGPDELPARVLKEISQSASGWLAFIFQQSLNLNTVPTDWSKALITAVYRKDSKSLPSNYRPISLTSTCCKVMEHISYEFECF